MDISNLKVVRGVSLLKLFEKSIVYKKKNYFNFGMNYNFGIRKENPNIFVKLSLRVT